MVQSLDVRSNRRGKVNGPQHKLCRSCRSSLHEKDVKFPTGQLTLTLCTPQQLVFQRRNNKTVKSLLPSSPHPQHDNLGGVPQNLGHGGLCGRRRRGRGRHQVEAALRRGVGARGTGGAGRQQFPLVDDAAAAF